MLWQIIQNKVILVGDHTFNIKGLLFLEVYLIHTTQKCYVSDRAHTWTNTTYVSAVKLI